MTQVLRAGNVVLSLAHAVPLPPAVYSTPVPDELFDQWLPRLSGAALKCCLYIIRRTLGFQKDWDQVSLAQLESGITTRAGHRLDGGTGLARGSVLRGLKELRGLGLLAEERHRQNGRQIIRYTMRFQGAGASRPTTPVPDNLFDTWLPQLKETELKCLLYIVRRTCGFGRTQEQISLTQLESGIITRAGHRLDHGTGLARSSVVDGLAGLRARGLVAQERGHDPARNCEVISYAPVLAGPVVRTQPGDPVAADSKHAPSSQIDPDSHPAPVPGRQIDPGSHPAPVGSQSVVHRATGFRWSGAGSQIAPSSPVPSEPVAILTPQETARQQTDESDSNQRTRKFHVKLNAGDPRPGYSPYIAGVVLDYSRELADALHGPANVTQALRLWQAGGQREADFVALLHEARRRVRTYQGRQGQGNIANKMAYFFRVLEDLVGVAEATLELPARCG